MNPEHVGTIDAAATESLAPNNDAQAKRSITHSDSLPDNRSLEKEVAARRRLRRHSLRHRVEFPKREYDLKRLRLPPDLRRVHDSLKEHHGAEYALQAVFTMRCAVELHRAWHMTLLTSKLLQQLKDEFKLKMTWNLGVVKLIFRFDDGWRELHRRVPYDYDSEFQNKHAKIAVALISGHIDVYEALIFQLELKDGLHTAKSGLFLRDFPGRLVLYPLEAATCAVIFFGGDWEDGGVAAVCGLAAGLVDYALRFTGQSGSVVLDFLVGTITGIIAGLFYALYGSHYCLSAIFMGTLYWFFYGTAFVIGLIEIIAGELETGVTRFMAVSVKTFVLCLGAGFGLLLTVNSTERTWEDQYEQCGTLNITTDTWWRVPLYLLCSASALGQYKMPIVDYWRGLLVQLAAYEVQFQVQTFLETYHRRDNMDTAAANICGAMAAVYTAFGLAAILNRLRRMYYARLLLRDDNLEGTVCGNGLYSCFLCCMKVEAWSGLARQSDMAKVKMRQSISEQLNRGDPENEYDGKIELNDGEKRLLIEAIIGAEGLNIWALLMPAVYQLVPGSMIARLWFNSIFPPSLIEKETEAVVNGTSTTVTVYEIDQEHSNVFSNLMVIATSLAVGIILGFASMQALDWVITRVRRKYFQKDQQSLERKRRWLGSEVLSKEEKETLDQHDAAEKSRQQARDRVGGMFTADNDDPDESPDATIGATDETAEDTQPPDVVVMAAPGVTVHEPSPAKITTSHSLPIDEVNGDSEAAPQAAPLVLEALSPVREVTL